MTFKAFVVDLDGVIYIGDRLLPGAREKIEKLRRQGRVIFLTNNSTKSRKAYVDKLLGLGIEVSEYDIFTSGYASALYIKEKLGIARVFVVGEEGLKKELEAMGHEICFRDCNVVITGLDRDFNYSKMAMASRFIREGAEFIATSPDATFITERGLMPGGGAIVKAIEVASGRNATVVGKPSKIIGKLIMKELGVKPAEILLIGDRLETDIAFGKAMGMKTALVFTGVTKEEEVKNSKIKPDFVLDKL